MKTKMRAKVYTYEEFKKDREEFRKAGVLKEVKKETPASILRKKPMTDEEIITIIIKEDDKFIGRMDEKNLNDKINPFLFDRIISKAIQLTRQSEQETQQENFASKRISSEGKK